MFAVIKSGGKQYSIESGKKFKVEKINGKKGDSYSFDQVLIIGDDSKQTFGTPIIKGASVKATIIEQIKSKKIVVFKKRRRKNYKSKQGHRQLLTILKIDKIISKSSTTKTIESSKSPKIKDSKKIAQKNVKKTTVNTKNKTKKKKTVKNTKVKSKK